MFIGSKGRLCVSLMVSMDCLLLLYVTTTANTRLGSMTAINNQLLGSKITTTRFVARLFPGRRMFRFFFDVVVILLVLLWWRRVRSATSGPTGVFVVVIIAPSLIVHLVILNIEVIIRSTAAGTLCNVRSLIPVPPSTSTLHH